MSKLNKEQEIQKGFALSLLDKIDNESTVHMALVRQVEAETNRNLVVYMSFLRHPAAAIVPEDSNFLETVFRSMDTNQFEGKLDLLIQSPGGSPTGAEQIILTCRSFSKHFRVLVDRTAMSAATLVAMGADAIAMTETAQLGPIDPQMILREEKQEVMRPAAAFVDAYTDLIGKTQGAIKAQEPPHPYLELLRRIDPTWIQVCLKARELSRTIAEEYLGRYMLKGRKKTTIKNTVERFMKEGEELSHGRAIRAEKAKKYGLKIQRLPATGPISEKVWELTERCQRYVQRKGFAKYFLCRSGALNVLMKKMTL